MANQNWKQKYFSFEGRIGRGTYFKRTIIISILQMLLLLLFSCINDITGSELLLVAGVIISIYASWSLAIRRSHDLGKSGYFVLLSFVPVVNIYIWIKLLFEKGQRDDNVYGPALE